MENEKLSEGQQILEDTMKMFLGQSLFKQETDDDRRRSTESD